MTGERAAEVKREARGAMSRFQRAEPYIPNMRARESFRPRVSFGRVERTSGYYPGKARYGQVMAKGQLGPIRDHHSGTAVGEDRGDGPF